MIRFINIGDQITDDNKDFAFYDTVREEFLTFSGFQRWRSVQEFKQDYDGNDIERFLNLIPKDWDVKKDKVYTWNDVKISILGKEISFDPIIYVQPDLTLLKHNLKEALDQEDYLKANEIKLKIQALKNGLQSNS